MLIGFSDHNGSYSQTDKHEVCGWVRRLYCMLRQKNSHTDIQHHALLHTNEIGAGLAYTLALWPSPRRTTPCS